MSYISNERCPVNFHDKQLPKIKHPIKSCSERVLFMFLRGNLCPADNPSARLAPSASLLMLKGTV